MYFGFCSKYSFPMYKYPVPPPPLLYLTNAWKVRSGWSEVSCASFYKVYIVTESQKRWRNQVPVYAVAGTPLKDLEHIVIARRIKIPIAEGCSTFKSASGKTHPSYSREKGMTTFIASTRNVNSNKSVDWWGVLKWTSLSRSPVLTTRCHYQRGGPQMNKF